MPTGYTADIANGISFKQYALNCARAFGALVMMRDDPMDAPIPDKFEPSDYNKKELKKAQDRLQELNAASQEQLEQMAQKDYEEKLKYYRELIKQVSELRKKYEDMLAQAKAYIPPTDEHIEYGKFLVSQIQSSIEWDCNISYLKEPVRQSVQEYLLDEKAEAVKDINFHKKQMKEEEERTNQRNEWIAQLKKSLS